ncbi:MAG: ABC transporter substrate-binding protein [Patescibacteria group bacterium]
MKKLLIVVLVLGLVAGLVWFFSSKELPDEEVQKTFKVGILYKGANFKKVVDGFVEGFNENLGGRKVEYVIQDEKGSEQKDFDITAKGLIDNKVDLIVAIGIEPVLAAQKATIENKIPVILELGVNPETLGVVDNFQRPGGNMTGVTWQVEELSGKRLEFLKKVDPRVKRVTIFRKKGSKAMEVPFDYINPVAKSLGITVTVKDVTDVEELKKVVLATTARDTDAFFYAPDPFVSRNINLLIKQAVDQKISSMFHDENWVTVGGLSSYGGNFHDAGKQGARLAAKILFENKSPAEIPVEIVSKIDFVVNLATAKKIGLTVSPEVLSLTQVVVQ